MHKKYCRDRRRYAVFLEELSIPSKLKHNRYFVEKLRRFIGRKYCEPGNTHLLHKVHVHHQGAVILVRIDPSRSVLFWPIASERFAAASDQSPSLHKRILTHVI